MKRKKKYTPSYQLGGEFNFDISKLLKASNIDPASLKPAPPPSMTTPLSAPIRTGPNDKPAIAPISNTPPQQAQPDNNFSIWGNPNISLAMQGIRTGAMGIGNIIDENRKKIYRQNNLNNPYSGIQPFNQGQSPDVMYGYDTFQKGGTKPTLFTDDMRKVRAYQDSANLYNGYMYQKKIMEKLGKSKDISQVNFKPDSYKPQQVSLNDARKIQKLTSVNQEQSWDEIKKFNNQRGFNPYTTEYSLTNIKDFKKHYGDNEASNLSADVIKYYEKLGVNPKNINYYRSPDLYHPKIKPTGEYIDGSGAFSPIFKKPVQPYQKPQPVPVEQSVQVPPVVQATPIPQQPSGAVFQDYPTVDVDGTKIFYNPTNNQAILPKNLSIDQKKALTDKIIGRHKMSVASMRKGGSVSPEKAREILHDGTVHGNPLTEKQRKFFGAMSNKHQMGGAQQLYNFLYEEDDEDEAPSSKGSAQNTAPSEEQVQEMQAREEAVIEQERQLRRRQNYLNALSVLQDDSGEPSMEGDAQASGAPMSFTQGNVKIPQGAIDENERAVINQAAAQQGIPPNILAGVYGAESAFGSNPGVSSAGAQGYFQFMPATAKQYGVDPHNFVSSATGAAKYLKDLYNQFGDWNKAIAAYNAGPGNIKKGRYPAETRAYVPKVLGYASKFESGGTYDVSYDDYLNLLGQGIKFEILDDDNE